MMTIFKAGAAFAFAALLTGTLHIDTPRWRAVAVELHQARAHSHPIFKAN